MKFHKIDYQQTYRLHINIQNFISLRITIILKCIRLLHMVEHHFVSPNKYLIISSNNGVRDPEGHSLLC